MRFTSALSLLLKEMTMTSPSKAPKKMQAPAKQMLSNAQTIAMFANWVMMNPSEDYTPVLNAISRHYEKQLLESKEAAQCAPAPMLYRAQSLIEGDRQQDYGDKLQNFSQIAMLFQGSLAMKLQPNARITPEDVAILMMQVKIARLAKSPDHKDSIMDVAGYAGCFSILQDERAQERKLPGAIVDPRG